MTKYYFYALNATLSDWMTMSDLLSKKDVEKGFIAYSHVTGLACLAVELYEDSKLNPKITLSQYCTYEFLFGENGFEEELDQKFELEDALLLALDQGCDLVQTKNLARARAEVAAKRGLEIEESRVAVSKKMSIGMN
jgi:hypothetical protein